MALSGRLAPPRLNGEVVFEAPWQSRIFALASALCEQGAFDWDEFRQYLICEIGDFELNRDSSNTRYHYFEHFLSALTKLLREKDLLHESELNGRIRTLAARSHGHDH